MSFEESSELPEGWAWAKLGDLGVWAGGGTPTTSIAEYWDNGTIPWISAKDMKADYLGMSQDSITEAGRAAARLSLLPPGTVLLVVRGMILARDFPVAVTTAAATINQDLRALIPSPAVEPRFLLRALQFISDDVVQATGEATHGTRRLESDKLKAWPLPIPPLAEQQRIVTAVERVFESVSSARDRLKRVPTILTRLRQAVVESACSGQLTADWREVHDVTEAVNNGKPDDVQEAPGSWEWVTLGAISEVKGGVTKGRKIPAEKQISLPYLRVANVQDGFLDLSEIKLIPALEEDRTKYALEPGDILFIEGGNREHLGRGTVWRGEVPGCIHQNHVFRARLKRQGVLPEFVSLAAKSEHAREYFFSNASQTVNLASINLRSLSALPLPLPPTAEQAEIVRRASALLALADSIEERATLALQRVQRLPQGILAKAFRGELVPTEAELARRESRSYEPASELLARLKASANGKTMRPRARKASKQTAGADEDLFRHLEG